MLVKTSYRMFFHEFYNRPLEKPCFESVKQFIKTAMAQDCFTDKSGNNISVEVLTNEIFPLLDSDIQADFAVSPFNGKHQVVYFTTPSKYSLICYINNEFDIFKQETIVKPSKYSKPSSLEITYKEFFSWYFGVPTGHPMDAPIYRHGLALQTSKEGMNFQNSLDAFKYECETQDDFLDRTSDGLDKIDIQVCIDEIYPILDSDDKVDIEIRGDTYCFTLPSGRRLEMCCADDDYSPDWRDRRNIGASGIVFINCLV